MKRNDDIKEYLRGNRKGEAANRLEREALSDPFLFEALEGLTTTPGDPIDGLIRLERQLNERARASRKGRTWLYIAASFVVFAICGTLWFTLLQEKDIMSDRELAQLPVQGVTPEENKATLTLSEGTSIVLSGTTDSVKEVNADKVQKQIQKKVVEEIEVMEMVENEKQLSAGIGLKDSARIRTRQMRMVAHAVEGIVTDTTGAPLPGVTVMLEATNTGTITDTKGYFRIDLPASRGNLSFHFVGMKPQVYSVSAGNKLHVKMKEEQTSLDEVIITGYQSIKKQSFTGSVTTIREHSADSLVAAKDVANFNRYLQGALRYPSKDLKDNNQGVIKLSFELNKKMSPSRIRIQEGFSKECNQEMIRLLLEGPKWENSLSKKRIYASVRFVIGKDGQKNTAILTIEKQDK